MFMKKKNFYPLFDDLRSSSLEVGDCIYLKFGSVPQEIRMIWYCDITKSFFVVFLNGYNQSHCVKVTSSDKTFYRPCHPLDFNEFLYSQL